MATTEALRQMVVEAESARITGATPDPTGCGVAYGEYRRQAVFASLFTAAWFALIAMTALVGIVSLGLLIWVLLTLQSSEGSDIVVRLIGTAGTAAGSIATGIAATQVKKASDLQSDRAKDAAAVASTACNTTITV
jgi:hypothetical protein